MYISPREVADTRDHTLHNLLAASTAYIEAGERLTNLFARAGRDAIAQGGRQLGKLACGTLAAPAEFWSDILPRTSGQLLEEAFDILGSTHSAVIQATQAQIRTCDQLLVTAIDRAAQSSPWEGEIALAVMKSSLQSAENTLQSLTNVAIQTVELAESQVKQVTDTLGEGAPAKPAARPSHSKKAQ